MSKILNIEKYKKAHAELLKDESLTLTHLSTKYGFSRACFSKYLKSIGYEVKKRGRSYEIEQSYKKAVELYAQGMPLIKIGKILNVDRKSLGKYFKEKDIPLRTTFNKMSTFYEINENYFDEIDTEEKAYWLGFIYADGNVRNTNGSYQLVIELNSIDFNHLKKFRKHIGSNKPIKTRKNRNMCSITLNSKNLVTKLFEIGCIENKTVNGYIEPAVLSNDMLKKAFLRGFLDGDGYIEKNTSKYRAVYTVKSEQIRDTINELLNEMNIKTRIQNEGSYYRIHIERKDDFNRLLELLYKDASVYLDRKYGIYLFRSQPFQEETLDTISAKLSGEALPNMYEEKDNILG